MTVQGPVATLLAALALTAATTSCVAMHPAPGDCKPCGDWQLDAAASDSAEAAVEAAMAHYKEPRIRIRRLPYGDIAAATEAEFQNSLDRMPGPESRGQMRQSLTQLLHAPATLSLHQDRDDIVIESEDTGRRRVTPGEPHARVDSLGTARIVARWTAGGLTVNETYRRKVSNRDDYVLEPSTGRLKVTRSVSRPGLPALVVETVYRAR